MATLESNSPANPSPQIVFLIIEGNNINSVNTNIEVGNVITYKQEVIDEKIVSYFENKNIIINSGFEVEEVLFLLETVVKSGKKIIGLDLNEVAPGEDEWDANVGARMLYKLCNIMAVVS